MLSFRKKLMSQFRENLQTGGRTDGRTDGLTLFHRTLPAMVEGPIKTWKLASKALLPKFQKKTVSSSEINT